MKAKVPPDAPLLVEPGSARPEEVAFDAKEPYRIAIVITNGSIRRKFVYIDRNKNGIFIAHGSRGSSHESYYPDGKRRWKFTGINEETGTDYEEVSDLPSGPPLDRLTGFLRLQTATVVVSDDFLGNFSDFSDHDGPFDKIVYLDSRALPKAVNYEVMLVEPFRHGLIPFHTNWPCHFQLFTRCLPWIALLIYEQWPIPNRRQAALSGND
jgi:hypothetical protein